MAAESEQQSVKEQIVEKAKRGEFNGSPLLTTPHRASCENCGQTTDIVYLDYLKSGKFNIADPQAIETESPLGAFMASEQERVTQVIVQAVCGRCECPIEDRPFTVEYLNHLASRTGPSTTMWS
jgi:hypothetical protein